MSTTSTAGRPSFSMIATGMPRPSSTTVTELSGWIVTDDLGAEAGERLVDGVVDDLVDEVVQAQHAGRADVHAGALADRLEALEDRDVLRVVAGGAAVIDGSLTPPLPGALLRAVAACGQWPSDDVRTPRNPGARRPRAGAGEVFRKQ